MSKHTGRALVVMLSLALSGCIPAMQKGTMRDVNAPMPEAFGLPQAQTATSTLPWRQQVFDDPNLAALIDAALGNNQELQIVGQEIFIGRAELGAKRGEFVPRLGVRAGAGVEKVGLYTSQGANDANTEILPGREVPEALGDFRLQFDASWEVDVWGKLRKSARAARYRYLASIEGRNFVVTQLVSEVATTYYALMALDRELEVVDANIQLLTDSLEIVRLQKDAARVTELAVQRFDAELLKNQSRHFEILQEIVQTENELNFLCGRYPQPIKRSSEQFDTLKVVPFSTGTPGQLLERRPDVRQAELTLQAAKMDVASARAAFYPSLSIDAELGQEAFALAKMTASPESLLYGLLGNLTAPLLNRSVIRGQFLGANAMQMQAVFEYERTLLLAYIEVVNQRTHLANLAESYRLRSAQVERLEQAIETSNDLFQSARADYLEVLTTRRDSLDAKLELIETQKQQLEARVDLYRALGGGWEVPDATSP